MEMVSPATICRQYKLLSQELKRLQRIYEGVNPQFTSDVRLWYIPLGKSKGTELEKHIILDAGMRNRNE
jgi:hypothetical protein